MNGQMDPAEVLAVEIRQYVGEGVKALIPRVIGQTAEAQQKKSGGLAAEEASDEETFFRIIETKRSIHEAKIARETLEWAKKRKSNDDIIWWGKNQFTFILIHKREDYRPLVVSTSGELKIQFRKYPKLSLPDSEGKLQEFLGQLSNRGSVSIQTTVRGDTAKIDLAELKNEANLEHFLDTLDWLTNEIRPL